MSKCEPHYYSGTSTVRIEQTKQCTDLAEAFAGTSFLFRAQDILFFAKVVFSPASLSVFNSATAVATIIITIFVIIVRITMRIGFLVKLAFLSGFQFRLIFRVQTLALGAVVVVVIFSGATAVSTIPTTTAVIIFVIARLISFPRSVGTFFVAYLFQ